MTQRGGREGAARAAPARRTPWHCARDERPRQARVAGTNGALPTPARAEKFALDARQRSRERRGEGRTSRWSRYSPRAVRGGGVTSFSYCRGGWKRAMKRRGGTGGGRGGGGRRTGRREGGETGRRGLGGEGGRGGPPRREMHWPEGLRAPISSGLATVRVGFNPRYASSSPPAAFLRFSGRSPPRAVPCGRLYKHDARPAPSVPTGPVPRDRTHRFRVAVVPGPFTLPTPPATASSASPAFLPVARRANPPDDTGSRSSPSLVVVARP